ncbi:MAG: FGGY family carbohydrate kinase [Streptosporangiaceae bacterium]
MIADWMVFRLTGTLATEASIGSTSGLFDLGRRAWSPELLIMCGLESALFPQVVEAGTVVGQVSGGAFTGQERAMRPSLAGQRAYDQLYALQRPDGPGFRGAAQ